MHCLILFVHINVLSNCYIDHVDVVKANEYIKQQMSKQINPIFINSATDIIPPLLSGRVLLEDFYTSISQIRIL